MIIIKIICGVSVFIIEMLRGNYSLNGAYGSSGSPRYPRDLLRMSWRSIVIFKNQLHKNTFKNFAILIRWILKGIKYIKKKKKNSIIFGSPYCEKLEKHWLFEISNK